MAEAAVEQSQTEWCCLACAGGVMHTRTLEVPVLGMLPFWQWTGDEKKANQNLFQEIQEDLSVLYLK
jgi:hypothetical protein